MCFTAFVYSMPQQYLRGIFRVLLLLHHPMRGLYDIKHHDSALCDYFEHGEPILCQHDSDPKGKRDCDIGTLGRSSD